MVQDLRCFLAHATDSAIVVDELWLNFQVIACWVQAHQSLKFFTMLQSLGQLNVENL